MPCVAELKAGRASDARRYVEDPPFRPPNGSPATRCCAAASACTSSPPTRTVRSRPPRPGQGFLASPTNTAKRRRSSSTRPSRGHWEWAGRCAWAQPRVRRCGLKSACAAPPSIPSGTARRFERELRDAYRGGLVFAAEMDAEADDVAKQKLRRRHRLAALADSVRGYGDIKERSAAPLMEALGAIAPNDRGVARGRSRLARSADLRQLDDLHVLVVPRSRPSGSTMTRPARGPRRHQVVGTRRRRVDHSASSTCSRDCGSRLLVGSSRSSTLAREDTRAARARRVFSPPDSVPAG